MPMVACPACFRVCLFDDRDHCRVVGGLWGADGQLGAMGDAAGMVCHMFWGCCSCGMGGLVNWQGVQEADQVRRGKVVGIDAGGPDTDSYRRQG